MSEDFKRKLKQYADGTLPENEREDVERELDKLEAYQTYLDELMEAGSSDTNRKDKNGAPSSKNERAVIRRGKWKARFVNAATVLAILCLVAVISSVLTGLYYGTGEPNRMSTYQDVVKSAIAITKPNVTAGTNAQGGVFFTMKLSGPLNRQVGDSQVAVGDFSMKFMLGMPSVPQFSWRDGAEAGSYTFFYPSGNDRSPVSGETNLSVGERPDREEWTTLEKLPEGTVAEAYLSFNRLFGTDELLALFEHKNMMPVWFAADAGPGSRREDSGIVPYPVGFPYWPIWHADDLTTDFYEEKKSGWFGKIVTSGGSYPSIAAYGDGAKRNENFVKTLKLLQQYRSIAKQAAPFTDIGGAADYIGTNGVKLYGAVVTGPVKELLKLREESWVERIRIGEVRLWNWRDR